MIPVNEIADVVGGDYDDYDIVDYVYEYDDVAPLPAAPPPPPPPPPPQNTVIPVYGLHDHDKYSASPVLLHDHPPHPHRKPQYNHGGYHVSVDTPSFRYNIEQYGEAPKYGHYEPPPPPPRYGHYEPPPPPPVYGHYEPPSPPPKYGHYEPPPPNYVNDPYLPKYHEPEIVPSHLVDHHHKGPYRPKFGYPKPIPHMSYQGHNPTYRSHHPPPPHQDHHEYHPYPLDEVHHHHSHYHEPHPHPRPSDSLTINGDAIT